MTSYESTTWLGPLCAFMSSITWAIGTSAYSKLSKTHSAFSVNFTRAMVSLPFFIAASFILSPSLQSTLLDFNSIKLPQMGWLTLSAFASYGIGDVLFMWSTRSLGIPGALAIASSFPIWTALGGILFRGDQVTAAQVAGLLITVSGIITVILNSPRSTAPSRDLSDLLSNRVVGTGIAFVTSIFWAMNTFSLSQVGTQTSTAVGNSVRMILAMVLSAALSRVLSKSQGLKPSSFAIPKSALRSTVWVFILEGFLGAYLFMYGLSHSPLILGATLTSLAPVLSVPVSLALRLEKFSFFRSFGVVLVVVGLAFLMQGIAT